MKPGGKKRCNTITIHNKSCFLHNKTFSGLNFIKSKHRAGFLNYETYGIHETYLSQHIKNIGKKKGKENYRKEEYIYIPHLKFPFGIYKIRNTLWRISKYKTYKS